MSDQTIAILMEERDAHLAKAAQLTDQIERMLGARPETLWSKLGENGI